MTENSLLACPDWPQVDQEEVEELLSTLKCGKAVGPDQNPPDVLKIFPSIWATILDAVFTIIDRHGLILASWRQAIVVPIFKKGNSACPANYRPISLLSVIGKLYASHLA